VDRIIQALYQLNDLQFDLLSNSQYQLDVCWPTIGFVALNNKKNFRNNKKAKFYSAEGQQTSS